MQGDKCREIIRAIRPAPPCLGGDHNPQTLGSARRVQSILPVAKAERDAQIQEQKDGGEQMREGDMDFHPAKLGAESPGGCWYPARASFWAEGCSGTCGPTRVGMTQAEHCKAQGKPTCSGPPDEQSQQEGRRERRDALPGPDPCCRQPHACSCPRARTGRSNRPPVLSLSGFPASQRLELKNLIFPFSGASAPVRGREQSREAPTLPAAPAAAKDALTTHDAGPGWQHSGGGQTWQHSGGGQTWQHMPCSPSPGGAGGCAGRCSSA